MLNNKQYNLMLHREINKEKFLDKLDYQDVSLLKTYLSRFMKYNKLIGLEVLIPYTDNQINLRACGYGMVHAKGTPLEGVELWESINDMLKIGDRVNVQFE